MSRSPALYGDLPDSIHSIAILSVVPTAFEDCWLVQWVSTRKRSDGTEHPCRNEHWFHTFAEASQLVEKLLKEESDE